MRKPNGAEIRQTVVIALPSISGLEPYSARIRTSRPKPTAMPIAIPRIARYQPGPVSFDSGRRVRSRSATTVATRYPFFLARRRNCRRAVAGARTAGATSGALLLIDPGVEARRVHDVRVL